MIFGIGVDIVKISRIKNMKSCDKFAKKILSDKELSNFNELDENSKISYLSKQFAAKEAFSKAFGTGISGDVRLKEIRILRNENGKPYMHAGKALKKHMDNLGIREAHVSLSDEDNYVIAYALLER